MTRQHLRPLTPLPTRIGRYDGRTCCIRRPTQTKRDTVTNDYDSNRSPPSNDCEALLVLPDELRGALKEPLGPIETDANSLLESVSGPLIAVGDVVTYTLGQAGERPAVALVDGRTERTAVDDEVADAVTETVTHEAENPPAVITEELVRTLMVAVASTEQSTILVDGEEDLATLPAIIVAPTGASVVYGQPGEGMVHVRVDEGVKTEVRALLDRFDGDVERFRKILDDCEHEDDCGGSR